MITYPHFYPYNRSLQTSGVGRGVLKLGMAQSDYLLPITFRRLTIAPTEQRQAQQGCGEATAHGSLHKVRCSMILLSQCNYRYSLR